MKSIVNGINSIVEHGSEFVSLIISMQSSWMQNYKTNLGFINKRKLKTLRVA